MKVGDLCARHLGDPFVIGKTVYVVRFIKHKKMQTTLFVEWEGEEWEPGNGSYHGDRQFPHDEPCYPWVDVQSPSGRRGTA